MNLNRRRFFGFAASLPVVAAGALAPARADEPGQSIELRIKGSGSVNVDEIWDQLARQIEDGGGHRLVAACTAAVRI